MATTSRGDTLTVLRLSSSDRTSGTNDAPVWRLARPTLVRRALVSAATIPNTMYTISTGVNDIIPTTAGNATIPPGVYTPTALAAAAQTALLVVGASFTCTYSATTLRFTIGRGATVFGINWATGTATNARRELGYAATDLAAATSYVGDAAVSGSEPAAILLRSAELSGCAAPGVYAVGNVEDSTTVARIPLAGSLGVGASSYEAVMALESQIYSTTGIVLREFSITLWDAASGRAISLNGAPWTVEITLWVNEDKTRGR